MIAPSPWEEVLPTLPTPYFNGLPLGARIKRVEEHSISYFQPNAVTK